MRFEGCCSYPHGYGTTLGFFAAVAGGLAATCYSFISCRFVVVTYVSNQPDFELSISGDPNGGSVEQSFRVAAGLFTWFEQGQCFGYRQTMLDALLSDPIFSSIRIMAVMAVLFSITMLVWVFLMTTLSMLRREIWGQTLGCFILTLLVGLSFLIFQSSLCDASVGDRQSLSCSLDQGGLVAVAATILWFVAFLMSCLFVKARGMDLVLVDGELRSEFEERQKDRQRLVALKALQKERHQQEEREFEQQRRAYEHQRMVEDRIRERDERSEQAGERSQRMMPAAGTAAAIATTAAVSSAAAATIYLQDEYDDDEESETTPMNMLEQDEEDVEVEHANEPMADPVEPEGEVQYDADEEDNAYFSKTLDNIVSICGPHDEVEL